MTRLIDLSHTVESGMVTLEGFPAPLVCDFLSREASHTRYAPGTEFQIGKIEMIANTGTYVDAPFHRYAKGEDLSELALESVANLDAIVVHRPVERGRAIPAKVFADVAVKGKAVLVHTGWDRHWRTDQYFRGHPYLTKDAAQWLADRGAALVGIDSLNIDDNTDGARPVHTILLGAGIPIAEHLTNLGAIPDGPFRFTAAPVKVKAMGSFPVRAFAAVAEP
ncbi:MAG TPA: cyclase family protein [Gemmatimonadales bacterium]|nr:cyclase family protein [Gemmatimonadales bacterium]